ncbi:hypothetical protein DNH61_07755 [Paenibacillus sambharensis]|uniref:DUF3383 domain-containing protein n=2 Tax=Paenibacillus sambharensis TaxID=1803190 RepID=A0A2W1LEG5_9BACL|nr:hypothetical protein DNH61_07755 [Paenibacillus sambharensis]
MIEMERPVPKLGFGKPLILGTSAEGSSYKTYSDIASIAADYGKQTEEYKAAFALLNQGDDSPGEVAIYCRKLGTEMQPLEDSLNEIFREDWYFLIATTMVPEEVEAIAAAVEMDNSRQYFTRSDDMKVVESLKAKGYTRTTVLYHTNPASYPEAAWVGRAASSDVGSVTWKFKKLAGINPLEISGTGLKSIHDLSANTYVTKAGDPVTSEGKTLSGEYIDIIHAKDYVRSSIEQGIQQLLNSSQKIAYDDTGIAQLESVVRTVLQRAYKQGIIAEDEDGLPMYGTNFKTRAEVDASDRAERNYKEGQFWFDLAGAIHETTIRGQIRL